MLDTNRTSSLYLKVVFLSPLLGILDTNRTSSLYLKVVLLFPLLGILDTNRTSTWYLKAVFLFPLLGILDTNRNSFLYLKVKVAIIFKSDSAYSQEIKYRKCQKKDFGNFYSNNLGSLKSHPKFFLHFVLQLLILPHFESPFYLRAPTWCTLGAWWWPWQSRSPACIAGLLSRPSCLLEQGSAGEYHGNLKDGVMK